MYDEDGAHLEETLLEKFRGNPYIYVFLSIIIYGRKIILLSILRPSNF